MEEITLNVKLKGKLAVAVNEMLEQGYSSSKEDLVRASIISYGTHLGVISGKALHKDVLKKIRASGKKYTDDEIMSQIEDL